MDEPSRSPEKPDFAPDRIVGGLTALGLTLYTVLLAVDQSRRVGELVKDHPSLATYFYSPAGPGILLALFRAAFIVWIGWGVAKGKLWAFVLSMLWALYGLPAFVLPFNGPIPTTGLQSLLLIGGSIAAVQFFYGGLRAFGLLGPSAKIEPVEKPFRADRYFAGVLLAGSVFLFVARFLPVWSSFGGAPGSLETWIYLAQPLAILLTHAWILFGIAASARWGFAAAAFLAGQSLIPILAGFLNTTTLSWFAVFLYCGLRLSGVLRPLEESDEPEPVLEG